MGHQNVKLIMYLGTSCKEWQEFSTKFSNSLKLATRGFATNHKYRHAKVSLNQHSSLLYTGISTGYVFPSSQNCLKSCDLLHFSSQGQHQNKDKKIYYGIGVMTAVGFIFFISLELMLTDKFDIVEEFDNK